MAFAAVQFSLIRQGRFDEARNLEDEFGSDVKPKGDYGFARSLVLAWLDVAECAGVLPAEESGPALCVAASVDRRMCGGAMGRNASLHRRLR